MEYNNYKKNGAGCDIYGSQRLELALYVKHNILNKLKKDWFIENGTLLGAWRNNKFIAHDDDFDIALLINSKDEIIQIFNDICKYLVNSKYEARLISTYSDKIEVYEPSYGKYILQGKNYNGADFHYVCMDIQFYLKKDDLYERLYYNCPNKLCVSKNVLLPTKLIKLEDNMFNCPFESETFLKKNYGSLDPSAKYNSITGLYHI